MAHIWQSDSTLVIPRVIQYLAFHEKPLKSVYYSLCYRLQSNLGWILCRKGVVIITGYRATKSFLWGLILACNPCVTIVYNVEWRVISRSHQITLFLNNCVRNPKALSKKQENSRSISLWPFLWRTTTGAIQFAHASPWLFTRPMSNPFLCTLFPNVGQGLQLLIYHLKVFEC